MHRHRIWILLFPVVITAYSDKTFTFITKTPPVSQLIKKALNLEKGSATPNTAKIGTLTQTQVEEIAKIKLPDLNCYSLEEAKRCVVGSAQSMGVEIEAN